MEAAVLESGVGDGRAVGATERDGEGTALLDVPGDARDREIRHLAAEFTEVAVHLALVQVRLVELAAGLLALQGGIHRPVATWLASHAGLSTAEAKRLCRLARRLPDLPLIEEAFRAGRLSLETVDLLVKVATPANERAVLETAGTATGCQLRKIIRRYKAAREAETPEPDRAEHVHYGADDTRWWITGRVGFDRGAEIEAGLRAAKDDLYRSQEPPAGEKATPVSTAEALAHLSRSYLETRLTTTGQLPERFQAIIHVDLTDAPTTPGHDGHRDDEPEAQPTPSEGVGADAPVDLGRPRQLPDLSGIDPDEVAYLRGIGAIGGSTLDRLLCNATISAVVSRNGTPVTVTSPTRLATPAQKRALLARHSTCQFPGCGHTAYLEAHHVIAHHTGEGPTAWANLALLCTACHTRLHQPGWASALTDDHTLLVWDPRGELLNRGALRPTPATHPADHSVDGGCGCDVGKFRNSAAHIARRRMGAADRLNPWSLGVYLEAWLAIAA